MKYMNISQNEIEKIANIVKEQLPSPESRPDDKFVDNGELMFRLYGEVSLFKINEIQNRIEGWDMFVSSNNYYGNSIYYYLLFGRVYY